MIVIHFLDEQKGQNLKNLGKKFSIKKLTKREVQVSLDNKNSTNLLFTPIMFLLKKSKQFFTKTQNLKYTTNIKQTEIVHETFKKQDDFDRQFQHIYAYPEHYLRKVKVFKETRDPSQYQQFENPVWKVQFIRGPTTNWADPLMGKYFLKN